MNVLLTTGRMPKGLELARALAGSGHRVVVADPFRWHIAKVSNAVMRAYRVRAPRDDAPGFLVDVLDVVARERIDLVVPVSEEAMHVVELEGRLPRHTRLFAAPRDLVHALHDKLRFNRLAAGLGLPVPSTEALDTPAAEALVAAGAVVVKPVWSCGGSGVHFVDRGGSLGSVPATRPGLVQARVDGRHLSTCSVAWRGRVLGTAVYEGTVFSGTVAVAFQRVDRATAIEEWIEVLVRGTGYSGFISFDFIVAEDGVPMAIECNPRITSGVHLLDPRGLAAAVTNPESAGPVRPRAHGLWQHFYTSLMETERALLTGKPFRAQLAQLRRARDVVWDAHDPLPFLLRIPVSHQVLRMSMFGGMSMGEAATRDIGWFGPASGSRPQPGAVASRR